ncbi:hypothetical protein [Paraburkholderia aromaticivorans]|uniref:hypothetical protein n=1 Tax=Paraburkholderia aromaticivorans TaxID=2026199 RepID=UPI0014561432|nr:hypothetical protein [Paraburkholderia aromaticivorans]
MRGTDTVTESLFSALVENSIGVVMVLNPYIGYVNATMVAQEALVSGVLSQPPIAQLGETPQALDDCEWLCQVDGQAAVK